MSMINITNLFTLFMILNWYLNIDVLSNITETGVDRIDNIQLVS